MNDAIDNTRVDNTRTDNARIDEMRPDNAARKGPARLRVAAAGLAALALGACAIVPAGPSTLVLPGTTKTFDQFRYDDAACRNYAWQQIGGASAAYAANDNAVRSGIAGAAIGAIAGAALGGSRGAGVGAGTGLLVGSASAGATTQYSSWGAQRAYDNAYVQCMYSMGHRVPVSGRFSQPAVQYQAPGAAYGSIPPPPPGLPPAPPTR